MVGLERGSEAESQPNPTSVPKSISDPPVKSPCYIVDKANRELTQAGIPEPRASAEILLSELLDIRRGNIRFDTRTLTEGQMRDYEGMISRRLRREPVQRILGYAYFRNLKLMLNDETLIPRPDTESVVEAALEKIDGKAGSLCVLDIGTGTGAIATSLSTERLECEVHASDINEAALAVAKLNAQSNGAELTFHHSDLAEGLKELTGRVDLLISNPPYIERKTLAELEPEVRQHDPHPALDGGFDGLDFYRRIFSETSHLLKPNADVVLEVGDYQAEDVLRLGEVAGFFPTGTHDDLAGTVRAVTFGWSASI